MRKPDENEVAVNLESRSFGSALAAEPETVVAELERLQRHAPQVLTFFAWINIPLVWLVAPGGHGSLATPFIIIIAVAATLLARNGGERRFVPYAMTFVTCLVPMLAISSESSFWRGEWYAYFFVAFALILSYVDWRQLAFAAVLCMSYVVAAGYLDSDSVGRYRTIIMLFQISLSCAALIWTACSLRRSMDRSAGALFAARESVAAHEIFKAIIIKGTAGVGVFVGHDGERTLAYANSVLVRQLNFRGDPIGKTSHELVGPVLTRGLIAKLRSELNQGEANGVDVFPWISNEGERWLEIDTYLVDVADSSQCLVVVTTDVTAVRDAETLAARARLAEETNLILEHEIMERKNAEQRLAHAAYHDVLTGLPNRLLVSERLELVLRRASRLPERSAAVLFIDLDGFKLVNDRFGHTFADLLLVAMARRFEACLRADDIVARIGSDEFIVLLENVSSEAAITIANVLMEETEKPFDLGERRVVMSASIGLAPYRGEGLTADELMFNADMAMQRAKALGKHRCEVFVDEMRVQTQRTTHLGFDLRHAIARQEFEMYYQPIVFLASGQLAGFEALVRWNHPKLGLVAPSEFIALAEETGAIVDLGAWALRTACRQLAEWNRELPGASDLTISVNVSARQLVVPGFPDLVVAALRESQLAATALHLEITESAVVHEPTRVASELVSLRSLGVSIAMDDFGTGYSSLAYLKAFQIDSLKIDRSFVSDRGESIGDPEIVRSVIVLAKSLGLMVVAEGVETPEQEAQLRELGCTKGQGYLFAQPLTSEHATSFIARGAATERTRSRLAV